MSIKAVLFDLDATLLPMDQDVFIGTYFKNLTARLASIGYDPKLFGECLWKGVGAMVNNDGSRTNSDAFWSIFTSMFGTEAMKDKDFVDEYYNTEYNKLKSICGFNPAAKEVVKMVRESGKIAVLATNPLFPSVATENRMSWAGLEPGDFDHYTTYDNSTFSKPNLKYYEEVLDVIGCKPEECIMVGNDVDDDMVVTALGMKVFLLTDCLINKNNVDISQYPNGGFEELKEFIRCNQ